VAEPGAELVIGFAAIPHRLCRLEDLSLAAYRVLGALMYYARDTGTCEPTNADLSEATGGLSVDAIVRALANLEALKIVTVERPTPRSRGPIRLLFSTDFGGSRPVPTLPKIGKGVYGKRKGGLRETERGFTGNGNPPTPPNKEGELIKKYPEGGGVAPHPDFAEAGAGDIEPFAAPAPETPPAVPAPPPSGWRPEDFARLDAEAERLFPLLEFGTKVRRSAHLYPPAYFEAALKEAARTGKRIRFPYVLAICQRFEEDGGPPPPERSGVGVRPQGPSTPIPDYVTPPPNGYRKSYPTPKKRGQP
jgi:hypothetical protein